MKEIIKKAISDFKFKNFPKRPHFVVVNELDFNNDFNSKDLDAPKKTSKYYITGVAVIRSHDVDRGEILIG